MFEMEVVADYVDLSSHWLVGMVHKKKEAAAGTLSFYRSVREVRAYGHHLMLCIV